MKAKIEKTVVIAASTVAVLTFSGIASWKFLSEKKREEVIKFAQSTISGQNTKKSLITNSLDAETVKSLQGLLSKTGFGYGSSVDQYKFDSTAQEKADKGGTEVTSPESLYMMCLQESTYNYKTAKGSEATGKVSEKPDYEEDPGEEPKITSEKTGEDYHNNSGWVEYTFSFKYGKYGESKQTKTRTIRKSYTTITPTAEDLKKEEEYQAFYKECQREWEKQKDAYNKWAAWKKKRDNWLKEIEENGYLETRKTNTEYDDYAHFWTRVAMIAVGQREDMDPPDSIQNSAIDILINKLYPQVYDENGEQRSDVRNLLNEKTGNIQEDLKDLYPDREPDNPNQGGSGSGSTGNTVGGTTGGSTGGGTTGGGTTGGSTGGGTTGGGTTGGTTSGDTTEDKEAPKISKASIISPTTGVYGKGQEIKIRVDFDKNVYSTDKKGKIDENTAPKLLIQFGDKEESKLAKFESATAKSITYSYIIAETDHGKLQLQANNNYVGSVYNESGYKAELTNIQKLEENREIQADNVAPEVEKIEIITQEEAKTEYKTEEEIQIKVTFNEAVYTSTEKIPLINKTAPVLNIRFGEGEIKNPSVKLIHNTEHYIIYVYKITEEDRGELKLDAQKAFDGTKTIYDQVGNEVTLITGKEIQGSAITVNSNLTQISFDKKEITLDLNGTKTAELIASKNRIEDLTWESSDQSVVTIKEEINKVENTAESEGILSGEVATLTAVGVGEANILAKAEDGTTVSCKVTVKDTTKGVTKVELNKTKLEFNLKENKTENLTATVTPSELTVQWSSTNDEIATVDQTGKVTAIKEGKAQIIAKAKDGTTTICEVVVIDGKKEIQPETIELNATNIKVALGKTNTISLTAKIKPANKDAKIAYESSNEEIATVDENGKVTIKAKGGVVITATTENGKKAYCAIEVVEDSELENKASGDVNGDGKVDTTDLLGILRHIATTANSIANKHQEWKLQGDKYMLADVNGNGIVDVTDSLKLQRHLAASQNKTIKEKHPDWLIEE